LEFRQKKFSVLTKKVAICQKTVAILQKFGVGFVYVVGFERITYFLQNLQVGGGKYVNFENFEIMLSSDYLRRDAKKDTRIRRIVLIITDFRYRCIRSKRGNP